MPDNFRRMISGDAASAAEIHPCFWKGRIRDMKIQRKSSFLESDMFSGIPDGSLSYPLQPLIIDIRRNSAVIA